MRVLKFGGSSLSDAERFLRAARIVISHAAQGDVSVVLSAPGKTTNKLVDIIRRASEAGEAHSQIENLQSDFEGLFSAVSRELPDINGTAYHAVVEQSLSKLRHYVQGIGLLGTCPDHVNARIISRGERVSVQLMRAVLEAKDQKVALIDPVSYFFSKGSYLEAMVDVDRSTENFIQDPLPKSHVLIMPGFTAGNEQGELVCLGRNGSDYSAAILAACLRAECCEIWTDVDGVYNCDPRLVKDARLLRSLSYQEARELSYFGASILHPKTIAPIAQSEIPCLIKNSFNPQGQGTLIGGDTSRDNLPIKAITTLNDLTMVNVSGPGMKGMVGMASRVFGSMSTAGVSVVLITQSSSEYSISFCIEAQEKNRAKQVLTDAFELELKDGILDPIEFADHVVIMTLVGDGMRTASGIASQFFRSLAKIHVNVVAIAQGSSERAISAVISEDKVSEAIRACHENLFGAKNNLDVFVMGVHGIGGKLIDLIAFQQPVLAEKGITIRVCGLADGETSLLKSQGIRLDNWREKLSLMVQDSGLAHLTAFVRSSHVINPVLVDCTSSEKIANQYEGFIAGGFHVMALNKKVNTIDMSYYRRLRDLSRRSRSRLMYKTIVGAGVPISEDIKDVISVGDEMKRIVGVFSSSLSFIFGRLEEGISFSEATDLAIKEGLTEPDIRDDLSGRDTAGKLLLLAREAGLKLEFSDIDVDSVLPPGFDTSGSSNEFMARLPSVDSYFKTRLDCARKEGKVLRYIAEISDGKSRGYVSHIEKKNPIYKVKDGERAIAIYSSYYHSTPLVFNNYGYGIDTAATGIFSDLMRTLRWDSST